MATVQKAMAQHEQRSLHTFFVKHGSRPAKDCPQPERLPTVQPKTPPASETTDSNPSGGHSSDWLTVDDDLSRRKRRKTTPPEYTEEIRRAPGSSSAVAVAVIIDPECPPPVSNTLPPSPSDWPEERPGNARYSLRKAATNLGAPKYVFENPLKDEISKNKRKVLQLNPNGKLLDLPVKGDGAGPQETSKEAKQRDRPRKRPKLKSERPSKIAIIRYGSEKPSRREHLGQEIYEIINGLTTYNLLKKRAEKLQLSQGPPKPTHPFFLAKQFPNKIEDAETQKGPHAQEGINAPKDQQRPLNPLALNPFAKAAGEPRAVSAPKLFTKPKRADDPVEPIWPPCGMIHVQGSESELNRVRCEHATFDLKKAKGSEAKVPGAENILATILRSIRKDCPRLQTSMELPLRNPRRMLKPGHDLQGIISEKLNQNPAQRAEEALGRSVVNSISSKSVHPAIANLLSSIATSRSSFEKGGYEELTWAQKYAPDTALKVLQAGPEAQVLRSWLQKLTVTAVNTTISKPESKSSKVPKAEASKRKKRKRAKDLDDFIVSSDDEEPEMGELPHEDDDDEDELAGAVTVPKRTVVRPDGLLSGKNTTKENSPVSNTILLSGPPGCGKTAAVYAVASELGFEVFEVNAGSRRSARDVVERVGDMAQNHLVQILNQMDGDAATAVDSGPDTTQGTGKQTSMSSFFKQKPTSSTPFESKAAQPATHDGEAQKPKTNQRQSLILLEEVDVLFNEDKQFWSGVLALITQSKRPIVMTCNDESLLPMENLSFHAMLRFRPPPPELVADYLSVLCANEGHIIEPQALLDLYATVGKDLRATIMQLNYWCQMAVGSQKSGLDWIVDRPWLNRLEDSPDVPRIISLDTYIKGMGWLSRDMAMDEDKGVENRTRLVEDFLNQWHVSPVDWVESKVNPTCCKGGNALEQLEQASFMSEMESALDLSCPRLSGDLTKGTLDKSLPPPPDKQRLDYIEGYQFLQTEPLQDYSGLSDKLGVTIGVLLEIMFTQLPPEQYERDIIQDISRRATIPAPPTLHPSFFEKAFSPIIDVSDYSSSTSGYRPLSFEHGASVVSEDVAPYIRSIVAFDLRLEQQRIQLSGLLSQGARRPRTTRASRAAVEGGDKAMIRRERWFPGRIVPSQVKMTGGLDWENILLSHLQRESDEKRVPGATEIPEGSSDCPGKIEYSSTDKNVLSI